MCSGPIGPARCSQVEWYVKVDNVARSMPPLPVISNDYYLGPICISQFGRGPCHTLHMIVAAHQVASTVPARLVYLDPYLGPICEGPLGPGACQAVKFYMLQQFMGLVPPTPIDLRNPQVRVDDQGQVSCNGPFGWVPCEILQQQALDLFAAPLPSQSMFNLPTSVLSSAGALAKECARISGLDVTTFAACTGRKVVLPPDQNAVLDCAIKSSTAMDFSVCAAPRFGIGVSPEEAVMIRCAQSSKGDSSRFAECSAGSLINIDLSASQKAVLDCASSSQTPESFATCAAPEFLEYRQSEVLKCAVTSDSREEFASCASPHFGVKLSDDQRTTVLCAAKSGGDAKAFLACSSGGLLNNSLTEEQRAALTCAANDEGNKTKFVACAAEALLGKNISREQKVALQCAAEFNGHPSNTAACAGANLLNLNLNPEQQIAVQCLVQSGGEPFASAGCMASRLTARELTKCMVHGVGGKGCFGDSNDLVGKNGWVMRNVNSIAGGPNSIFRNPDQIWGGDNSFLRNPGQIWGGSNSFIRRPEQIFGGPNSVFRRPSQILPKPPPPLQVGKIGKTRICIPWC